MTRHVPARHRQLRSPHRIQKPAQGIAHRAVVPQRIWRVPHPPHRIHKIPKPPHHRRLRFGLWFLDCKDRLHHCQQGFLCHHHSVTPHPPVQLIQPLRQLFQVLLSLQLTFKIPAKSLIFAVSVRRPALLSNAGFQPLAVIMNDHVHRNQPGRAHLISTKDVRNFHNLWGG